VTTFYHKNERKIKMPHLGCFCNTCSIPVDNTVCWNCLRPLSLPDPPKKKAPIPPHLKIDPTQRAPNLRPDPYDFRPNPQIKQWLRDMREEFNGNGKRERPW
jgi:hypothetical protein